MDAVMLNGLGGSVEPVRFEFNLNNMTNVTGKTSENQRVMQDFTNYINANLPDECAAGTWLFLHNKYVANYNGDSYNLVSFIIKNGIVQGGHRKGYDNSTTYMYQDCTYQNPTGTGTWMWGSYTRDNVYYLGYKISD